MAVPLLPADVRNIAARTGASGESNRKVKFSVTNWPIFVMSGRAFSELVTPVIRLGAGVMGCKGW